MDRMPMGAGTPNLGYSPGEFQQWYQSQYQTAPTPEMMQRIAATVGPAAGPNGLYSQDQFRQGQQLAQQDTPGFFPTFNAPTFEAGPELGAAPTFDPGSFDMGAAYAPTEMYKTPEAFSYEAFAAPTAESVQNDPGYQFALQQGTAGIMGNKAAAGLARTGGTLKDLMQFGQGAATQYYNDAFNRQAQTYGMNRANAADTYATNYNIGRTAWQDREGANQAAYGINQQARQGAFDRNLTARQGAFDRNEAARLSTYDRNQAAREGAFDRRYRGASDQYNAAFRGRELAFEDLFRRWQTKTATELQRELAK